MKKSITLELNEAENNWDEKSAKKRIIEYTTFISSLLIAALFLYAAYIKFKTQGEFVQSLNIAPYLGHFGNAIAWLLPILELIIAVLLFVKRTRLVGLWAAFGLLLLLSAYVFLLINYPIHSCTCLGIFSSLTWDTHLFINLAFTFLALLGLSCIDSK
jgi:hypothetical protein